MRQFIVKASYDGSNFYEVYGSVKLQAAIDYASNLAKDQTYKLVKVVNMFQDDASNLWKSY